MTPNIVNSMPRLSKAHIRLLKDVCRGNYYEPSAISEADRQWLEDLIILGYADRSALGGYKPTQRGWETITEYGAAISFWFFVLAMTGGLVLVVGAVRSLFA